MKNGVEQKISVSDLAFLPAHLELLHTPPSSTLRITAWSIICLIATTVIWSSLSKIEIVATAQGRLVPVGEVKLVQSFETSVVRGIHVNDGDHVSVNQILIDLDPTEASADLETTRLERVHALLDAESARVLLTENPDLILGSLPDVDENLTKAMQLQLRHKYDEHRAALAEVMSEISDKQAALSAKMVEVGRNSELVPLAEDRYNTQRDLFERGNASKLNLLQAQYDLIDKRAERKTLPEQISQLDAEMSALQQKATQMHAQFLKEAADQQIRALQKIAIIEQTLLKSRQREELRHLRASVTGIVQDLRVHTLGGVVNAAESLLNIVPDGVPMEVEAYVPHNEMGFIKQGQHVDVKLEAFPFARYGTLSGTVRHVAAQEIKSNKAIRTTYANYEPDQESGYKIFIALDEVKHSEIIDKKALRSGMRLTAEIKTGKRRAISFLLDPISSHLSSSFGER